MRPTRRQRRSLTIVVLVVLAGAIGTSCAHAGEWVQVSCVNPNGSTAPSQGWTTGEGAPSSGSSVSTECAPGTPMNAALGGTSDPQAGASVWLQYAPPTGSTIVGGTLDVGLASGSPGGYELGYEPAYVYPQYIFAECGPGGSSGPVGCHAGDYVGPLPLPSGLGGDVYLVAACSGGAGGTCAPSASGDNISAVQITSADILLSSSEAPTGAGFGGSALQRTASGVAHLTFTAGDPGGPGVYSVTASVDGQTVYSATPNTNDGACAPVGTLAGSTALEFDDSQPCLTSEPVDIPIPTAGLSDGRHELAVSVTDAAGNTSPVLDRTITTLNPQRTPVPHSGRRVRAVFRLSYAFTRTHTLVRFVTVSRLPRDARVTIRCTGRRCPALHPRTAPARRIARVLNALHRARFSVGDHLYLTVTAPHRTPERIALHFLPGHRPSARLQPDHHR